MFNLSLSRNDAAVMAVLIDIQRQSLSDQNQKAIPVNSYEIFEILRNYEKKPLKWPILTLFFEDIPFDTIKDEDIKKSLSRFFAEGYLSRSGEGYALDPALLSLSRNLVPTTFALLISGITRENSREAHEVNYPGHVVSCTLTVNGRPLPLAEAHRLFNRPVMGGLDRHGAIATGSEREIRAEVEATLRSAPERFILGADCTVPAETPWAHLRTAIEAAHAWTRSQRTGSG